MFRKLVWGLGAAIALTGAVAQAQDEAGADPFALLSQTLTPEPLTAEQTARLPAAERVVAKVMPDGLYARMMSEMFDSTMEPILEAIPGIDTATIAARLGMDLAAVEALDPQALEEIVALLDPAHEQRGAATMAAMREQMTGLFSAFEPALRSGLAEAYAVRFNDAQLADLEAFFATPTGAFYATESTMVFADPRTMAGMMESMPAMMAEMPDMEGAMAAAVAGLPPERDFADLSAAERARLAELAGVEEATLAANMAAASAAREATDGAEDAE